MNEELRQVRHVTIANEDDGARLDRWLKKTCRGVSFGQIQKWLRTGQIRCDGRRAKPQDILSVGQDVRLPPMPASSETRRGEAFPKHLIEDTHKKFQDLVIHEDKDIVAINKPFGLAVQGGTGTRDHLDRWLQILAIGKKTAERLRLVHRLDRDTSGLLLLAKSTKVAAHMTEAFKERQTRKLYWALVEGDVQQDEGTIRMALSKSMQGQQERVRKDHDGRYAETDFATITRMGKSLAFVMLVPNTGRTHQLRVHCAEGLEAPIFGDHKYGRPGPSTISDLPDKMMLHARSLRFQHPNGRQMTLTAPVPAHMQTAFDWLNIDKSQFSEASLDAFEERRLAPKRR